MILDFNCFRINESSVKKIKKELHGILNMVDRKRMRQELRNNIITFKFKKRNGEIRTAHGTLHPDYLPPLKGGSPRPEKQMVYFDLDKDGWRSFRSYKFIKILDVESIDGKTKSVSKPTPKPMKTKKVEEEDDDEMKKKHIHSKPEEKEEKEIKKPEHEHKEEKEIKKPEHEHKEDIHKKEFKKGDKIPEDELKRRSVDLRKDTRKNKFTKEANDDFKKKKDKKESEDE